MSSHYIYVRCEKCKASESIYTGDEQTDDFDEYDWEGGSITVSMCKECKTEPEAPHE